MIKLNATDIIKENKEPKASQVKQETPQEQLDATSRPEVVDAVSKQAPMGSNFAHLNNNVLELAEEIQSISPAAEKLRFCASGTEANMYLSLIHI